MGLSKMMKFVVLALVAAAAAEPEADSQFYSYAAPTAYSTTYNQAYPYSAYFPYNNFYSHAFPYSYATHHMTKRDAEAEPQTFTPYFQSAWPYTYPQTAYTNTHHLLPAVRTVAAPAVRTVASPLLKTLMPAAHRTYASVPALPTHHITNYNNAEQFTAHSNGVFGPKYIAKNGPVEHIVKREADAEPKAEAEAEADAQYPYSHVAPVSTYNNVAPITSTYSHVAPVATYSNVAPITSTYSNIAPITSSYKHVAPITSTYSHVAPITSTYKQVDPITSTYSQVAPITSTYSHVAPINAYGHQVALTHPSNVGVCLNNMGIQVPC